MSSRDTGRENCVNSENFQSLRERLETNEARIGVIGLGYVGLPLMRAFSKKGFPCLGFDIDPAKVDKLNAGQSYIKHIPAADIAEMTQTGRVEATTDYSRIVEVDALLICVPTPLTAHREPDLSIVLATAKTVQPYLRPGQIVVLESTTYPGTTREVLRPVLEAGGLRSGQNFLLAYSPEREDPANPKYHMAAIPKVVGGDGPEALEMVTLLYDQVVEQTVPVSSPETAEAVKLTENIYRAVNIAFVNELKMIYGRMGIDVWEVISAASTKPFGYTAFYPGPGLGGHCIPIDPFYLTWKAREHGISTRFIELAGEINAAMPGYVMAKLREALDLRLGKGLSRAKVLVIGVAYKKNVDDMRESPALQLYQMLLDAGAEVAYHDPHVPELPNLRNHPGLKGHRSITLTEETVRSFDATLIVTDHDDIDYEMILRASALVVDTRNVTDGLAGADSRVIKA